MYNTHMIVCVKYYNTIHTLYIHTHITHNTLHYIKSTLTHMMVFIKRQSFFGFGESFLMWLT